jgi:hypothetical protein
LPSVMEDLPKRFGAGKIALVADRGLISEDNLAEVGSHSFEHVMATRLHHDEDVAAVLEQANGPDTSSVAVAEARSFATEIAHGARRFIVVFSPTRYFRDRARHAQLCSKLGDGLIALQARVRSGRLIPCRPYTQPPESRLLHSTRWSGLCEASISSGTRRSPVRQPTHRGLSW